MCVCVCVCECVCAHLGCQVCVSQQDFRRLNQVQTQTHVGLVQPQLMRTESRCCPSTQITASKHRLRGQSNRLTLNIIMHSDRFDPEEMHTNFWKIICFFVRKGNFANALRPSKIYIIVYIFFFYIYSFNKYKFFFFKCSCQGHF